MKKRLLLLVIVLTLVTAVLFVPTAFADENEASISINAIKTPTREIDLSHVHDVKSIDMFVGESYDIKTDILVSKYVVIEDLSTIKAKYTLDESFTMSTSNIPYDDSAINAHIRREDTKITPSKAGHFQFITEYTLGDRTYFDSLDINVYEKNITSMALVPTVTSVRTNTTIDFDLAINDSTALSISDNVEYYINDAKLSTLKGYKVPASATPLNVKIVYAGKEYKHTIDVVEATELAIAESKSENYGYLLSDKEGVIDLYVTAGSYPNISIITKSATLKSVDKVDSDREGLDMYRLTLSLNKATSQENMLIRADNKSVVCKLNIIDAIYSISIVPDSTKFESNKPATFHVVINGVKDVDTAVEWTVNGDVQSNKANIFTYKSISNNDIKVTAKVKDSVAEYSYKIDNSMNSIILTVVVSLVVIIICIPILIALKKSPKPNLKAMITKDNNATVTKLKKLKDDINNDETKSMLKHILKINTIIMRSEKRAQQESFECENKAFGGALAKLGEAKALCSDLLATYKTNPKDVNINIIDNIIFCLESSNETIKKVEDNM